MNTEKLSPEWGFAAVSLLLLITSLGRSQLLPRTIGTVLIIISFMVIIIILMIQNKLTISIQPILITPVVGIFLISMYHVIVGNFTSSTLAILPIYSFIFVIVPLLILPTIIDKEIAMNSIVFISIILGFIGILILLLESVSIPLFNINLSSFEQNTPSYFPMEHTLTSILSNPNFAGVIFYVSSFIAFQRYHQSKKNFYLLLVSYCLILLFLTQARASMVALVAAIGLYLSLIFTTRRISILVIIFSMTTATIFVLSRSGLLSAIELFEQISLSSRDLLWRAGIDVGFEAPVIGQGFYTLSEFGTAKNIMHLGTDSVHSTYLLFFYRTGLAGLITIFVFTFGSILFHLLSAVNLNTGPLCLSFGFSILIIFESLSFHSIRLSGFLMFLCFGYIYYEKSNVISLSGFKNNLSKK